MTAIPRPIVADRRPPPRKRDDVVSVLVGHSGARVAVHRAGALTFVRKSAGEPAGNARLRLQAGKQAAFHAEGVATPRVLGSAMRQGCFGFDMEHVPAVSVAAHCASGSVADLPRLGGLLADWVDRLRTRTEGTIGPEEIAAKLRAILERCRANPALRPAMPAIELVGGMLGRLAWPALPRSLGHGDLTLENILVCGAGRPWLIDFDATDLSSYALDVAKLYQDLSGFWCLRHLALGEPDSLRLLNATLALRRLRTAIDAVVEASVPGLLPLLPPFVALHLLRTLPYCTDLATPVYVLERIRAVLGERGDPGWPPPPRRPAPGWCGAARNPRAAPA